MKIESPAMTDGSLPPPRPKTSGGYESRRTNRRPVALNLDLPRQPFELGPHSPTFGLTQPPTDPRRATGPPVSAAITALNRPSRSNSKDLHRQSRHQYTHSAVRASYSSSVYESPPQSPESPVIPLSGPLASPRPALPSARLPRQPSEVSEYECDLPDWSALAEDAPHRNWPLSSSGASQKPPQLSDPRSDSPFGIPSFSRPWTGANARPGTPVKTTEITITTSLRTQTPPKTAPIYGLRNPAIVGDDFGTGFI
ncbi:hypothetical protein PG984_010862 [Apiospora sp. TS-2023a]